MNKNGKPASITDILEDVEKEEKAKKNIVDEFKLKKDERKETKAKETLEVLEQNKGLRSDEDYQELLEENKETMNSSGWITFAAPTIGSSLGTFIGIFQLGLDNEKLWLLGSVLVGGIIGNILGGFIAKRNNAIMLHNRTRNVYLQSQNKLNLNSKDNDYLERENGELKTANQSLLKDKADLENELMEFRIEKRAKELNKDKE